MATATLNGTPADHAYVADATPLYARIVREITGGLRGDSQGRRIDDACVNRDFYRGHFERHSPRVAGDARYDSRFVRTSLVMQRAVDSLTDLLYRENPKRTLKPPKGDEGAKADYQAATDWIEAVYRANNMGAKWQEADRFTFISDVAAFQVESSEDPDCPIKIRLWDAGEFYAWEMPDDPTKAAAVAVRDFYDEQRRLRLYTAETVTEFRTKKLPDGHTWDSWGATTYTQVGYPRKSDFGVLPFSFFPYREPTSEFWVAGPGDHFRQMNDCVNKRLTDLFDSVRYNLNPILVVKNAQPGAKVPPSQPGAVWFLHGRRSDVGSPLTTPEAEYLQSDPSFVDAGWADLNFGIDHGLEMIGIAPAQIRMTEQNAASGDAIVAEQIAPVKHAEGRKKIAYVAEQDLCKLVLIAGAAHLESQDVDGYKATGAQLKAVAARPGLTVIWPTFYPRIPGNDANLDDEYKLNANQMSLVDVVARDNELTEEEARAKLEKIADDKEFVESLFGPAVPITPPGVEPAKDPAAVKAGDEALTKVDSIESGEKAIDDE